MKEEEIFFPVIMTCKDDMIDAFEASPKIQLEIEQFADEQMESIADNMGMLVIDTYWDILREAVERELNR